MADLLGLCSILRCRPACSSSSTQSTWRAPASLFGSMH